MEAKKVNESRVIQNHLILPGDTNRHDTLFGGYLMSIIDSVAGITFMRHTRSSGVTASMDRLNFIKPLPVNNSVCVEGQVSGVGRTSVEVFVKVIGEELITGERFLAATAFVVFAVIDDDDFIMPPIEPSTKEDAYIMSGYPQRHQARLAERQKNKEFQQQISIENKMNRYGN